ncbi:hypothetical protein QT384_11045 (plasmid) [Arcobacter cryaerophilus gv. pseudocryaerophilus]|uniref:Restriction endonuclease subunit S n=3 Tax=Arcobacteraceae TaxID=2808963 RepID=A0AA96IKC7_9BACT|nr:hypothetical protein RMP68_11045 [Arcobacter sp. AZ-2023]WNL37335.1 hypothetical protein RMQ66_11045 [Arcobacter sp. AZ-2023]WPD13050.1 hypothetical protein QT384_11045 [Arcobacter sp. DSM 115960]
MSKVPKLRFKEFNTEYKEYKLSELLKRRSKNNKDGEFGIDDILSLSSHYGIVDRRELLEDTYSKVNHLNYLKTRINDFVYGKSISAKYPFGLFKVNNLRDGLLSTLYFTFETFEIVSPKYLDKYFSHQIRANNFLRKYVLVGDRYITADSDYILSGKIFIPIKQEQEKITSFLTSIDTKIEQLIKKEKLLQKYKKSVIQKIFNKKIRFKADNGSEFCDWENIQLGSILIESKEKSIINNQHDVLSSTKEDIVLQSEYFNREIASKDNVGYKILKRNQLVFSPQNLWLGNININTKYEIGIVSPSYKIYNIKEKLILVDYLKYIIKTPKMMFNYEQASEQGASIVRRSLNIDLFNIINIAIPSIQEQIKISNFLSSIDSKIEQTQKQLESSKEFKKALLQQMFV